MDANVTAPTITIDGVTSKPGTPVTMVTLDCDNNMFIDGHIDEGAQVLCDAGPHEEKNGELYCRAARVLKTWTF